MLEMNVLRGVVLDPIPLWREALAVSLAGIGVTVVAKTGDPRDAIAAVVEHEAELLVTAFEFDGGADPLAWISEVLERRPGTRVIAMSHSGESATIERAFGAGASAYVMKSVEPEDFASAVRQLFDHTVYYASVSPGSAVPIDVGDERAFEIGDDLTRRELEVLRLATDGRSNAELATTLWITEQTVKFHLSNVYRKLGVKNRTQASVWANGSRIAQPATLAA